MFENFEAALEAAATTTAIVELIDGALDDIKYQKLVDTNTVTNWLLDIRQLANG